MSYFKYNPISGRVEEVIEAKPDNNKSDKVDEGKYALASDIMPKIVRKAKGLFLCDKCSKPFDPKEALMTINNSISFDLTMGAVKSKTVGKNTYYLVSPCCHEVHLGGFEPYMSKDEPYVEYVD